MTCEQENYIQKFKSTSLSMDDVLDKLRVPLNRLHHDGMGGLAVGQEKAVRYKRQKRLLIDLIEVAGIGQCWLWRGSSGKGIRGYGQLSTGNDLNCHVHRAVFSILFGQVPDGIFVRHKCDNPPCCNPFHLEPGTPKDNMQDKIQRGRANWALGEKQGTAKLKEHQVLEIRSLSASGATQRDIAKRYGMGLATINHIIHRKRWGWLA